MAHPLLQLLALRPQLLAEHAQAYGELAQAGLERMAADWRQSALRGLVGLGALSVAAALAGVALMLWASLPALAPAALWVLACVPLPPLALGGWCLLGPRPGPVGGAAFSTLRAQLRTDLQLLQWGGPA